MILFSQCFSSKRQLYAALPSIHAILCSPILSASFIMSLLVGVAVFVAFKTAVPFLCTAVGKHICSLDNPRFEAEPPRFLGSTPAIFSPL